MSSPQSIDAAPVLFSWKDVQARYPDQWVTLIETDWIDDRSFEFRSTRVIGCGATREAAMDNADRVVYPRPSHGCFFTGRIRMAMRIPMRVHVVP